VNAQDDEGFTALMYAIAHKQPPDVITALLDAGSNVKIKNKFGNSALDYVKGRDDLTGTVVFQRIQKASQ